MTDESEILDNATETENEPVGIIDRLEADPGDVAKNTTTEPIGNSEQLEPEPEPLPRADARAEINRLEASL